MCLVAHEPVCRHSTCAVEANHEPLGIDSKQPSPLGTKPIDQVPVLPFVSDVSFPEKCFHFLAGENIERFGRNEIVNHAKPNGPQRIVILGRNPPECRIE